AHPGQATTFLSDPSHARNLTSARSSTPIPVVVDTRVPQQVGTSALTRENMSSWAHAPDAPRPSIRAVQSRSSKVVCLQAAEVRLLCWLDSDRVRGQHQHWRASYWPVLAKARTAHYLAVYGRTRPGKTKLRTAVSASLLARRCSVMQDHLVRAA